jgi:hypothetical protein
MSANRTRMVREKKTIETMIIMHCHDKHDTGNAPCDDCRQLLDYAGERLDKCPYQEAKPTCAKCPIHCYKPEMREKVRSVMKYSGPRMTYRHPILALHHFLDSRRQQPVIHH